MNFGTGYTEITLAPSAIYPVNDYVSLGAGLLGLLAGGMLVDDPAIKAGIQEALGDAKLAFEVIGVVIVILVGTYLKKRNSHKEA